MLTSEHIGKLAPVGAASYRLLAKLSDGSSRLYPADTGGFFRIDEPPANVPIGKYTVCYYDGGGGLIDTKGEAKESTGDSAASEKVALSGAAPTVAANE